MAEHIVQCRHCKERFDAQPEDEYKLWIMPSTNFYYHKTCYETWKSQTVRATDDDWIEMIYDLLARDLKVSYNYHQIEAQREKFTDQGMTNKGIYYTLYWHHITRSNKWQEKYGIGLVPHIYKEATGYWTDRELKTEGIVRQIEERARSRRSETIQSRRGETRRTKAKLPD